MIDFTDCPRVAGRAYNGANGKKIAVRYDGETWILKFPPNAASKPNELSYSNSCISEHLGSSIYRLLGIEAQETMLGIHVNGRKKVVCACKDFTSPGIRLFDFCSIKNTVIDSDTGGTGTELTTQCNILQPKIQQLDIESLVLSTPSLSALQQDFYIAYLNRRREVLF